MIKLLCTIGGAYFTKGQAYALQEDEFGTHWTHDDDGDYHEFDLDYDDVWVPSAKTTAEFEQVAEEIPRTFVIKDTQRLEELTEWCRNKPEEAAVRIMTAEKLGGEL